MSTSEVEQLIARIAEVASHALRDATTMPPDVYTSESLLALELQRIFAAEWICVGRVEEISDSGDYFTIDVAGEPLIVVRSGGQVRVFPNVCRHKWGRLAEGSGNVGRIVCPYHAWTYSLDGELIRTRYMDGAEGFCPADHNLPEVRSAVWAGFIYVNLDDAAPPLEQCRAELQGRIGNYHMEDMRRICGAEEIWSTNWKLLVENFTDFYHVFHTHRDTIDRYTPTEMIDLQDGGAGYSFGTARVIKDAMPESPFEPHHPDLDASQREAFAMIGVFPAQMLALAPDRVFYMCLEPLGVDKVRTKWGVACYDHDIDAETANGIEALYQQLNGEDRPRVEGIQKGVRSRFAGRGRLSAYENMNWEFTRYLSRRLSG